MGLCKPRQWSPTEKRLAGLTRVGVKDGRGDIERFLCALCRVVSSDGSRERERWAANSQVETSAGQHPGETRELSTG